MFCVLALVAPSAETPLADAPIGFASVNALGQNGTTGGAAGPTVTVANATDLAHYAGQNEGNYFENVAHPSHVGYDKSDPGRLVERNNVYVNSGTPETAGTVTEPRTYYQYTVDSPASVPAAVRAGVGLGKV